MTELFKDITVAKVIGIDFEPEDRDVGIFGNEYSIILEGVKDKDWDGSKICLTLFDNEMEDLLIALEPFFNRYKQEKKWSEQ